MVFKKLYIISQCEQAWEENCEVFNRIKEISFVIINANLKISVEKVFNEEQEISKETVEIIPKRN